jgi:hypothetical protein
MVLVKIGAEAIRRLAEIGPERNLLAATSALAAPSDEQAVGGPHRGCRKAEIARCLIDPTTLAIRDFVKLLRASRTKETILPANEVIL